MKRLLVPVCAILLLLLVALSPATYQPVMHTFNPLLTVDFESNGEGSLYRSNTFNDNASDVWARSVNSNNGPNNNTEHTYSGYIGNSWWVGEDLDDGLNPLDPPDDGGFLVLKTLDISAYQGGQVEVSAYLAGNTGTIKRYRANDYLRLQYAFDSDIATGANSTDGLPTVENLPTGNYTIFGAFYGTGTTTGSSSALINDADLDGDADHIGSSFSPSAPTYIPPTDTYTADSLKNQFAQWKFTFDVPASAQKVSVMFAARTTGGSEEIGIDQIVVSAKGGASAPSTATVAATAFLEGAYNGSSLNTTINSSIPSAQPYSGSAFNSHSGSESALAPAGAVDWVLVELREAASAAAANNGSKVGSAAGFLMSDGSIKATDGTSDLTISLSGNTGADFYVVIYHRNHLPIMSANAISESSGSYTIDFTGSAANTYQTTAALTSLSGGKFGMPAGDLDQDGDIDATDLSTWRSNNGAAFSYSSNGVADFNLDGVINAVDRNDFYRKNTSKTRQVPSS